MSTYRRNEIYLSDEVTWYLKILCKKAVAGTDASMTKDQLADNKLRQVITEDYPDLVLKYDEYITTRQERKKMYDAFEDSVVRSLAENEVALPVS